MLSFVNISQTLYEGMLDLSHMRPVGNAPEDGAGSRQLGERAQEPPRAVKLGWWEDDKAKEDRARRDALQKRRGTYPIPGDHPPTRSSGREKGGQGTPVDRTDSGCEAAEGERPHPEGHKSVALRPPTPPRRSAPHHPLVLVLTWG